MVMRKGNQIVRSVLLVFFILLIIGYASFKEGLAEERAYILEEGITYGMGDDVELKLDLARPAKGRGRLPALVFIFGEVHGTGSRTQYIVEIKEAAKRGYVAVTVDYRLPNVLNENGKVKYPFPAQIHDMKCAVRWMRANARKYNIDHNRIGVVGWSSGGLLALMLGLTDPTDGLLEGECGKSKYSSRVQAVVSLAGTTDLLNRYNQSKSVSIEALLGGTPDEVPDQYKRASPINYVSKDDPPVLIIQGDRDPWNPVKQAELFDAKMRAVDASHTLIILKNTGRGVLVDHEVWDFLDKHLKGD
jgi:acetyl esterase/lipase